MDAAEAKVSAFLSDSRVVAEKARRCKHSGCAYLVTGLTSAYCCRMCARCPGAHGPKCAKKLLVCSTPGCGMAVTGLSETHCCKACGLGRDHGPHCWCLPVELASSDGPDEDEESGEAEASALAPACEPCAPPSSEPVAPASMPAGAADDEPVDVSDAELAALQAQANSNRSSIAANAAVIQALREALAAGGG